MLLWSAFAIITAAFVAAQAPANVRGTNFTTVETLRECEPARIQWTGGDGPYALVVNVGEGRAKGQRKILYSTFEKSFDWTVDLHAGTELMMTIIDEAHEGQRNIGLTVQPGSSTCNIYGEPTRIKSSSDNSSPPPASKSKSPVGAIVGGVVGGVVGMLIILGLLLWNLRLRRQLKSRDPERKTYKDVTPFEGPAASLTQTERSASPTKQAFFESEVTQPSFLLTNTTHPQSAARPGNIEPVQEEPTVLSAPETQTSSPRQQSSALQNQHDIPASHRSEYEEDGGPIVRPRAVVHPPKYNSAWKS